MHYKSIEIKMASDELERFLKLDAANESFSRVKYAILYESSIKELLSYVCYDCAHCLDFVRYINIFEEFASKMNSDGLYFDKLRKSLYEWDKIKLYDCAIDNIENFSNKNRGLLNKFEVFKNDENKRMMYIDMNILIYILDEKLEIDRLNDYMLTSSPSILNEILLHNKDQNRCNSLLNLLKRLTNSIMVYSIDNKLEFVRKNFEYLSINKDGILSASNISEQNRLLNSKKRDLYFSKYNDKSHTRSINDKGLSGIELDDLQEILTVCSSGYTYDELKKINIYDLTHDELNHIIYTLYEVLDVIGFNKEKNEKTIRSSAHDIEHIKYASKCDVFLSADKKLCKKALEIYKFLGIKTEVKWLNEL